MSNFTHYEVKSDIQTPVLANSVDKPKSDLVANFTNDLQINITELKEDHIVFDLIGADASIANALRRILLAEVPTVAIETVYMHTNTSIIQDEVLSHRVGLIPIKVDPQKLQDYNADDEEEGPTDLNTIVFKLDVECREPEGYVSRDGTPYTMTVYSKDLEWQPQGNQMEMFPEGVSVVHPDIIIALLRPGQAIEFEAHCRRGVGKDHAKFSPVATAFYCLLPDVQFHNPVVDDLARELKNLCPMNVFDIEDIKGSSSSSAPAGSKVQAVAARPRDCTMCRECIRTGGWENNDRVKLLRCKDHYIFTVESTGCLPPEVLVKQAIAILKLKALTFLHHSEQHDETVVQSSAAANGDESDDAEDL